MPDYIIHSVVALVMLCAYSALVEWPVVAVCAHWYCWELAQRVAKDGEHRGALYWWRMDRWGNTARAEALAPIGICLITYMAILLAHGR